MIWRHEFPKSKSDTAHHKIVKPYDGDKRGMMTQGFLFPSSTYIPFLFFFSSFFALPRLEISPGVTLPPAEEEERRGQSSKHNPSAVHMPTLILGQVKIKSENEMVYKKVASWMHPFLFPEMYHTGRRPSSFDVHILTRDFFSSFFCFSLQLLFAALPLLATAQVKEYARSN